MINFFQGQYDYIYFFYGLSFLFLFIVCLALEKGKSVKIPWLLLGLFGLMHGINEWLEIYAMNNEINRFFPIVHLVVLGSSYLFLLEFSRRGLWRIKNKGLWVYPVVFLFLVLANKNGASGWEASLRYFLGFPAGLLAAWTIYKVSKSESNDRKTLFFLSATMASYALTTGLIVPKADFFLAKLINSDLFYHFFGFPIQLLRGIIALLMAVTLWYYSPSLSDSEYHPRKYILHFKPTKWIIIFSLVALIGLGWVFTNYLDYYAGIQIIKNTKVNRNSPLNKLIGELTRLEQATYLLSRFTAVKTALISSDPEDISKALVLMDKYKVRCGAFDCLLLNAQGLTVLSTDWSLPEGRTNKPHIALSYFKEALRGETGYYFIPGSTYSERVYYVGFPIKDDAGKVIGVIALKKIISVKPVMKYRLLSIIITMFICVITMIFFVVLRRKENLIEFIEDAHDKLQAVDKMKTDFISIVSHELRTPLTSIKNAVTILLKADLGKNISDSNKQELLGIILKNTNRQTRMVNDLLDVSKIEAGVLNVCLESLDALDIVREANNSLEPAAKEKGISLSTFSAKESVIVEFDPEHLRRILTNLITNAINFTPNNGAINIKIDDTEDNVIFSVSDTGAGIRDEDKPKLFNKFYRADVHARQKGGSGLGLVIAKGLVEAQGGRIWVDSIFEKGSSFYFTIPKRRENEKADINY